MGHSIDQRVYASNIGDLEAEQNASQAVVSPIINPDQQPLIPIVNPAPNQGEGAQPDAGGQGTAPQQGADEPEVAYLDPATAQQLLRQRGLSVYNRESRWERIYTWAGEGCNYGSYFTLALGGWLPTYAPTYESVGKVLIFVGTVLKPGELYFKSKAKANKKAIADALRAANANAQTIHLPVVASIETQP